MTLAARLTLLAQRVAAEFVGRAKRSDAAGVISAPVEWQGIATTDASGNWAVTFPAGLFAKAPLVRAQAIASSTAAADAVIASPTAATAASVAGSVVMGNVVTTLLVNLGANGLKKAGAGVAVHVFAQSQR